MDYLKNYPEKKNGKKYYPLVVCFGRFTVIRHLVYYPVVTKCKHVTRCHAYVMAEYVSRMLHFSCAQRKQFSKFPLRKSVKRICEYHLYGLYHV